MRPLIAIICVIAGLALLKVYVWDKEEEKDLSMFSPGKSSSSKGTGLLVDIYVADEVTTDNTIYASGTIESNEEVELKSEVSGRLVKLDIREGAFVRKGHLIAKLNDDDLVAQMKRLQFEEELADQTEARQRKLLDIDAISKEEYDLAMNKVNTLSADKELLEVQLEKTEVRAPFNGHIGFKNISEGAYITPSVVMATLVQTNPVKIDFSIPEKYTNRVNVGLPISFEVDGTDDKFPAKVIAIDPRVDEELRTLKLRAKADNSLGMLKPGMFVRVNLPLESTESIMVPTEAIVPVLKGKVVYVMQEGKAREVEIRTGLRTEKAVQVIEGLEIGDSIIVSALMSLKNDLPVAVQGVTNK